MRDRLLRHLARSALASPALTGLVGARRRARDAALDPQLAALLAAQGLLRLPALETMPPARARAFAADGLLALDVDDEPMDELVDLTVPGPGGDLPVRVYRPRGAGPHLLVYFHGGGGVIGSLASSEPATRLLAARAGVTIASVAYRLAPEHPHPAAVLDACAAYEALAGHAPALLGPGGRIAVGGDSFGGYLAAHVDRHARRPGSREPRRAGLRAPDLQLLLYPLCDLALTSPSIDRFAEGYLLTRAMMRWFRDQYLPAGVDPRGPSPLCWDDLAGAAPAIVVSAGFDPLVDEDRAYAARLRAAGVRVVERAHPGLVHGFLGLGGVIRAAREATLAAADDLARELG